MEWCKLGFEQLRRAQDVASCNFFGMIYPLRVIKQITTIFFATCADGFSEKNPELVKFVLDRDAKGLPPQYTFRVHWYGGGDIRQSGVTAAWDMERAAQTLLAEFIHPPFGYTLTFAEAYRPGTRPVDITDFASYDYDYATDLHRRLPVLRTNTLFPGDYRERDQVARDATISRMAAAGSRDPEEDLEQFERRR